MDFPKISSSGSIKGSLIGRRGVRLMPPDDPEYPEKYLAFVSTNTGMMILGYFDTLGEASDVVESTAERLFGPLGLYLPPDMVGAPKESKRAKRPALADVRPPKPKREKVYKRRELSQASAAIVRAVVYATPKGQTNGVTLDVLREKIRALDNGDSLLHNFARSLASAVRNGWLALLPDDRVRVLAEGEGVEAVKRLAREKEEKARAWEQERAEFDKRWATNSAQTGETS